MAEVGLAGVESGLSSINNKVDSLPTGMEETGLSDGLFTLWEPPESTIPELEYVCPSPVLTKARLSNFISIVFIHGPLGHPTRSWATSKVCWPKDLLPKSLPYARIMTFGHNTLDTNEPPLQIRDLAKILLESLAINRRLTKAVTRPLIFVAHSLGGLIVKDVQNSSCISQ